MIVLITTEINNVIACVTMPNTVTSEYHYYFCYVQELLVVLGLRIFGNGAKTLVKPL